MVFGKGVGKKRGCEAHRSPFAAVGYLNHLFMESGKTEGADAHWDNTTRCSITKRITGYPYPLGSVTVSQLILHLARY